MRPRTFRLAFFPALAEFGAAGYLPTDARTSYLPMSALSHHSPADLATASRRTALNPLRARTSIRFLAVFFYLVVIAVGLFYIYGRGTLNLPRFVYQGF